jgi:predicted transcriptional regulator
MESRKRWSSFLDEATGYNAKQRGDKAKENAKKFSKAKSAIKMAYKSMELMKNVDVSTIEKANELIAALEEKIEAETPPSESMVKKLNDLF